MRNTKTPIGGSPKSDDEFSRRPRSPAMKPADNRRVVNPNFLFFCQIVLLIIPIAVLYAGLYFMNVSSPIIVIVCGVIILGFLIVVICIRPFTTPEVKGEDTVPLTRDISPSGKYPYSTGIVTGGDTEKHQEPSRTCSLPNDMMREQQKVQDTMVEACTCSHNPSPHVINQGDGGELSDGSNTTLLSGKDSSAHSLITDSSDKATKKDSGNFAAKKKRKRADSNSEKTASSSTSSEQINKRGLLDNSHSSDQYRKRQNVVNFDLSGLLIDDPHLVRIGKHSEFILSSTNGSADIVPSKTVAPASTPQSPKPCTIKKVGHACTLEKQKPECRNDSDRTQRAERSWFDDSDDEPLAKQLGGEKTGNMKPSATTSSLTTHSLSLQSNQPSILPYSPCQDKDKSVDLPITIRLYPKSSKQGVFEWVEPAPSPRHKTIPVGGFASVNYNVQTIEIAEDSKVTVDESSQTMLPLDTDTLHQMMVSSLKESVKLFEDLGTQVEMPEIKPKPSSVVYMIDEKKPSRMSSSSKEQKSEPTRPESMQSSLRDSAETVKLTDSYCQTKDQHFQQTLKCGMASIRNDSTLDSRIETKDQNYQQTLKRDTVSICNDSILDFVMRRPFSGKSRSPVNNEEHVSFKTFGASFSDSKINCDAIDDENHKDGGLYTMANKIMVDSTTPPSAGSGFTPSRWSSCHSSRELLKCDLPYLKPKTETWKIKGNARTKITSHKKDYLSDGRAKEFYSALYVGSKDKKYQPSRLGLLVTESSKEEGLTGKRKAGVSPRTKKKSRISQNDHRNDVRLDGNVVSTKCSPRLDREAQSTAGSKLPNASTPNKHGGRHQQFQSWCEQSQSKHQQSINRYQQSPTRNHQSPTRSRQSTNRYSQSPIRHHHSPTRKRLTTSKKQESPTTKHESPSRISPISQTPKKDKNHDKAKRPKADLTDSKGRRSSLTPFSLDFSSGVNDDDGKKWSPKSRNIDQKEEPHDRKRHPTTGDKTRRRDIESLLMDRGKFRSPEGSPTKNKNRRISHKVESTLFKKSSSSYDNVIIERVIKQKKKTLKKFK